MTVSKPTGSKPTDGHPIKRAPFAPVLRGLPPELAAAPVDWSPWYVDDAEHVAESCEQGEIIRALHSMLRELARLRGWQGVYIGADNYFAWMPDQPKVMVSPEDEGGQRLVPTEAMRLRDLEEQLRRLGK